MRRLYAKYQGYLPAAFFIGGFIFDLLTTDRIDQFYSLVQQFLYLFFIMIFFYWEILTPKVFLKEKGFLASFWKFHVEALHFFFGSLLSLYTIFYFKSASLVTSFFFMSFLAGLLIINELPQFQKKGTAVRASLFTLCMSSYLIYLVPVTTGQIGWFPFLTAIGLSTSIFILFTRRISDKHEDRAWVNKNIFLPGIFIQLVFVILYFFKVLPPVPVSIKYVGIYHKIEKPEDKFVLSYERDWWRFWEAGAQTFLRREGDAVYCFVSIFSPTQFSDQVRLVWYYRGSNGWDRRDAIALPIRGGRSEGYRGYAYKSNFENGSWQVRVVTSDDREVGRISFDVEDANPNGIRQWSHDYY